MFYQQVFTPIRMTMSGSGGQAHTKEWRGGGGGGGVGWGISMEII